MGVVDKTLCFGMRDWFKTYLHSLQAVFRFAQKTPFEKTTSPLKKTFPHVFRAQRETVRKVLKRFLSVWAFFAEKFKHSTHLEIPLRRSKILPHCGT